MDQGHQAAPKAIATKPHWKVNLPTLIGFLACLGVTVTGLSLMVYSVTDIEFLRALLITGLGITSILILRDVVENRRYYTGARSLRNERAIEREEERKKVSGEAD